MSLDEEKYEIDGQPASARAIIELAKDLDEEYAASGIYFTSEASRILRNHGYKVGNKKITEKYKPN